MSDARFVLVEFSCLWVIGDCSGMVADCRSFFFEEIRFSVMDCGVLESLDALMFSSVLMDCVEDCDESSVFLLELSVVVDPVVVSENTFVQVWGGFASVARLVFVKLSCC